MRHGHSIANQQGIIVSDPENGCARFGLSAQGQAQVEQCLQQNGNLDAGTIIVSSDFRRARESADLVHRMLDCRVAFCLEQRLRERHFGELEMAADSNYQVVWDADAMNPDGRPKGAESVNQVMKRVTSVIVQCEQRHSSLNILLVSHGDALQILQTAFARQDGSTHRQLEHLQTAEIRRLILLPDAARSDR